MAQKRDGGSRSNNMRAKLIRASTDLFYEHGYHATGVQEIVQRAEATKGAFYHYFGSKDDVLLVIQERYLDNELATLQKIAASEARADEKVAAVIEAVLFALPAKRKLMSIFVRERRSMEEAASFKQLKAKRDRYDEIFTDIIKDGVAAGELVANGDPRVIGFGILGMCVWAHEWFTPRGEHSVAEISEWYSRMVLEGLRASST